MVMAWIQNPQNHNDPLHFIKIERISDRLSVIDNHNFYDRHTHRQTLQLYDRHGPEDQVSENIL